MGALAHRIGDKSVNSDGRENQRQQGKRTQNIFEKWIASPLCVDYRGHAHHATQREFDVDLRKRAV